MGGGAIQQEAAASHPPHAQTTRGISGELDSGITLPKAAERAAPDLLVHPAAIRPASKGHARITGSVVAQAISAPTRASARPVAMCGTPHPTNARTQMYPVLIGAWLSELEVLRTSSVSTAMPFTSRSVSHFRVEVIPWCRTVQLIVGIV